MSHPVAMRGQGLPLTIHLGYQSGKDGEKPGSFQISLSAKPISEAAYLQASLFFPPGFLINDI